MWSSHTHDTLMFDDVLEAALDEELGDLFEVVLPGEVKDYVATVSTEINSLDYDIADHADCFKGSDLARWSAFKVQWAEYLSNVGFFTSIRTAERFHKQFRKFRKLYTGRCGKEPSLDDSETPEEHQKTETHNFLGSLGSTGMVLAVVVVGGFLLMKWGEGHKWH